MKMIHCRVRHRPRTSTISVVMCLVMWAVLGLVQEQQKAVMSQESYLQVAWHNSMDTKLPLPETNPEVIHPDIQDDTEYPEWSPRRLQQLLESPTTFCRRLTNLGGKIRCKDCHTCVIDGNKYICFDPDVRPVPGNCLVYSFGVGNEMSFDSAMLHLNCSIFAFDMTLMNSSNSMIAEGLHFLDLGIASINSDVTGGDKTQWESRNAHFRTLEVIRDILGHKNRPIDILKLDIENMEWKVLGDILSTPEKSRVIQDVRQIALEIHLDGLRNSTAWERVVAAREMEDVLERLHSHGFHLVHTELNTAHQVYAEVRGQVLPLYRESLFIRRP
ncbi:Methyltransferase-like protein 24-like 3 [Homarus americanus]|uniref:Methyltransferase-like protein 24-like 3 n=1 Tax=Homarus americanus TaxID=6706 RepID=A0A8J5JMH9_HOMAM|nr:Methyltransferase-like protein 24-like 3 [Homarus americanus]